MKECYILRAVSGSGKSTVAKSLMNGVRGSICESDEYHMIDGEYKFKQDNLGKAHKWCYDKFKEDIDFGYERVVVSNTNTKQSEFMKYKKYAEENGYIVFVLTVENWHNGKDVHNVPDVALDRQEMNLRNSIKLRRDKN